MATKHKHPSFSLRIPQSLKDWAKDAAESDRRTLNAFIVKMIEDKKAEQDNANRA
jgi:predicted HicB family RNase H-like nuclease